MNQNIFSSFWMAGYECSDQLNCFGNRVDLLESSGHLQIIDEDYTSLSTFKIKTVREGIRWSQVEKRPYHYDWSTVIFMFEKGKQNNIQQIWDICHFGYADDLTPLHPMFARRFAALCEAFIVLFKKYFPDQPLIVTPINEVNFISWLGGEARGTTPYCNGQGWEVKYNLMKAYIEGINAMKSIDPNTRILTTEPLVNIVAPVDASDEMKKFAAESNENQYQAIDILCGKLCPELGGKPGYLDIIGFNFYFNNQWENVDHIFLSWKEKSEHPDWKSLSDLLTQSFQRYHRPILLSETSHPGIDRPLWIKYVGEECNLILQNNIPLLGICLYPIIDRTDWDHTDTWHHSGLWDVDTNTYNSTSRILNESYAESLTEVQQKIAHTLSLEKNSFSVPLYS